MELDYVAVQRSSRTADTQAAFDFSLVITIILDLDNLRNEVGSRRLMKCLQVLVGPVSRRHTVAFHRDGRQ